MFGLDPFGTKYCERKPDEFTDGILKYDQFLVPVVVLIMFYKPVVLAF